METQAEARWRAPAGSAKVPPLNAPGVPGIGLRAAAQLIIEYGDLETLLAAAHAGH